MLLSLAPCQAVMGESEHVSCGRRVYLAEKNNKIPKRGFRWFLCFPGGAGHMRLREVLSPGQPWILPVPPWLLLEALAVNSSVTSPVALPHTYYWF